MKIMTNLKYRKNDDDDINIKYSNRNTTDWDVKGQFDNHKMC